MRNPLLLLAAACLLTPSAMAVGVPHLPAEPSTDEKSAPAETTTPAAVATAKPSSAKSGKNLPTWTVKDETPATWRVLTFTDDKGKYHELWCRRDICDPEKKTGRAALFSATLVETEPYTYFVGGGKATALKISAEKGTYSTQLSKYELDLATSKAVIPGTEEGYLARNMPHAVKEGYLVRVLPPKSAGDKASPTHKHRSSTARERTSIGSGKKKSLGAPAATQPAATQPPAENSPTEKHSSDANLVSGPSNPANAATPPAALQNGAAAAKSADSEKKMSLEDLIRSKLSAEDRAKFDRELANAKSADQKQTVLDKYLAQILPSLSEDELAALPPDVKDRICAWLATNAKASVGTAAPVEKKALDQGNNINSGFRPWDANKQTQGAVATTSSGSGPLVASNPHLQALHSKCLNANLNETTSPQGPVSGDLTAKVPAPSGDDPKKPEEEKPNKWLAVKVGGVGAVVGMLVGSFFGPVGIAIGAAAGFGAFWGLSKLNQ